MAGIAILTHVKNKCPCAILMLGYFEYMVWLDVRRAERDAWLPRHGLRVSKVQWPPQERGKALREQLGGRRGLTQSRALDLLAA